MTSSTAPIWSHETGAGSLVVLVHGSMDRSAGLLRLGRQIGEHARVLRYDRRGYGRSTPHHGPFGMDEQLTDLAGLLQGRRAVVFGHSYGGNVALALADRHPDLVAGVAVYEPPLSWLDWWPGSSSGGAALAVPEDPGDAAERFMRRLVGDERWDRLPPSTRAARRAEGAAMVGELTDLRRGPPWSPECIDVPVTALYGEHGATHHRAATRHLGGLIPSCGVEMVAGARHVGPNTHARDVAERIERLLTLVD